MEKLAVHVEPFHNLLVGDENSTPISSELAMKLQIDVDGDFIAVANLRDSAILEYLEKQNKTNWPS